MATMKATLRDSRSSFAMTRRAFCFRQAASAFSSSGRSFRLPVSTSVTPHEGFHLRCRDNGPRLHVRLKAQARLSLLVRADAVVGNENAGFGLHGAVSVTGKRPITCDKR